MKKNMKQNSWDFVQKMFNLQKFAREIGWHKMVVAVVVVVPFSFRPFFVFPTRFPSSARPSSSLRSEKTLACKQKDICMFFENFPFMHCLMTCMKGKFEKYNKICISENMELWIFLGEFKKREFLFVLYFEGNNYAFLPTL